MTILKDKFIVYNLSLAELDYQLCKMETANGPHKPQVDSIFVNRIWLILKLLEICSSEAQSELQSLVRSGLTEGLNSVSLFVLVGCCFIFCVFIM